jgi:hypothetical protein
VGGHQRTGQGRVNRDALTAPRSDNGRVLDLDPISAEHRLYHIATRWTAGDKAYPSAAVAWGAQQAMRGRVASPALRQLAGQRELVTAADEIGGLLAEVLDELRVPRPGTLPPGSVVLTGGEIVRLPGDDTLRLEVTPTSGDVPGEFQVRIRVNGTEFTSAGAGLGMDPYDLLVPMNLLAATELPNTLTIARCTCGVLGCGSSTVTVTRHGGTVQWDWMLSRPLLFPAEDYDTEVRRAAADTSWETPERVAGRLIWTFADHDRLRDQGLMLADATRVRDQDTFQVSLDLDADYRISLEVPWQDRGPEDMANDVCALLARPPHKWRARWFPLDPALSEPPPMARRSWRRG